MMQIGAKNFQNDANWGFKLNRIMLKYCKSAPLLERGQFGANNTGTNKKISDTKYFKTKIFFLNISNLISF